MTHHSLEPAGDPSSSPLFLTPDPSSSPPALPPSSTSQSDDPTPSSPTGEKYDPLSGPDGLDAGSPSGPPSSGKGRRGAKLRELRKIARGAVETAGGVVHTILTARSPLERDHGLWVPDDDDVDNISEPLASLASRRAPAAVDNPDTVDLLALGMALFGYVMKNLSDRAALLEQYGPPADVVARVHR